MIQLVSVSAVIKRGKFKLSLLASLTLLGACCSGAFLNPEAVALNGNEIKKLADVFEDFGYAGAYRCPDLQVPVHGVAVQTFPRSFTAERCYVFHLTTGVNDGLALLLRHLGDNGVELTRYPRSSKDLVYPIEGGPLFRIDFRVGRTPGSILVVQGRHREAPSADHWKPDDYILVFKKR
jgi:hypothetical protein